MIGQALVVIAFLGMCAWIVGVVLARTLPE